MILALYAATSLLLLWLIRRYVRALSLAAAVVLLLMPLCFTGRAVVTGKVFAPVDLPYATEPMNWVRSQYGVGELHNGILTDLYTQMIPWRKAVQYSLARREWPLWNRFSLSGDILAAAAQPAAYSPFTWIACLLPIGQSFTFTGAIFFFVAGLSAFLYARELDVGEPAALFAGGGWMYATGLAFFILWPLAASWALFPFILLGVRRVVEAPGVRSGALLMIGLTLVMLAGHPESVLHIVSAGAIYGIFEMIRRRVGGATLRTILVTAFIVGVVTLALTAIYLLPILDAASQTMEHEYRQNVYAKMPHGAHLHDSLARFATDMLPFLHVRHWKLEHVQGLPIDSAAVGSIVLAAAIYAVWRIRSAETWFFFGFFIFSMLARMQWAPLARAMQKLPLYDIALNERFSFAAAFLLVILAALGIEHLFRRSDYRAAAITFTIVLVVLAIGTVAVLEADIVRENVEKWGDSKVFAELAFLGAATLLLVARAKPRVALPLLVGLLLAQRTVEESGVYPILPAEASYPPLAILEPTKKVNEPFRIVGHGLSFIPGTSTLYELEDVRGYAAMTLKGYTQTWPLWSVQQPVWFNRVDDLERPFLSFLNVRYALTWRHEPDHPGWREVARMRGAKLLENERAIERAFVPKWARIGFSDHDVLTQMKDETDFRENAWISAPMEQHRRANGPGRVTSIRPRKLGWKITAEMENDGWVIVSQPAWRGWTAYIDGRRIRHQIANLAFLGIHVPKGKHTIRLVFRPQSFVIGRAISTVTFATLIAFGLWLRYRTARTRAGGTGSKTT